MGNSTFQHKTVVDLFREQVDRTPDNIAVEFNGESLTYRQLDEKSNQLAHYLQSAGVGEETLVPICLNRSMDMIIGALGILKAGGAYVPIDPEYPIDRIEYTVTNANASILLTNSNTVLYERQIENVQTICMDLSLDLINDCPVEPVAHKTTSNDLCYVIYTSGSTGKPKGVQIEHAALANFLLSMQKMPGMTAKDVLLATTTIAFDIAGLELFLPLISGARIILAASEESRNGNLLLEIIKEKKVTMMQATPATWKMLLLSGWGSHLPIKILCGGEPLSKELAETLKKQSDELWNVYGPTETTIWSSVKQIKNVNEINIGLPIDHTEIFILNEKLECVPTGEVGQIAIAGAGIARGYHDNPMLTNERFIAHSALSNNERMYLTGDLGYKLPNDEIVCLGREDDQVKIRGFRIELEEIESVLQSHKAVQQAIVIAAGKELDNKRLVAYILPKKAFKKKDLLTLLKSKLPDYMIPKTIIEIDKVPLTPNGKIDKKQLPASMGRILGSSVFVAPRTKYEKQLSSIWSEVLNIDTIGITDNFFDLGGNSLLAQYVVNRLKEMNISVSVVKLYASPTIEKFAESFDGNVPKPDRVKRNNRQPNKRPVAIISMAGRFPGANDIYSLWTNLIESKESIRFFNDDEIHSSISKEIVNDTNYIKARGIISGADEFDPSFFNVNHKLAEAMDPQQRKFLEISWEALEQAGYTTNKGDLSIGVFAGSNNNSYYINNIHPNQEIINRVGAFQATTINDNDYLATRVAYSLNLKGPAFTIQSACSTSLLAISEAVKSIRAGDCSMALAGGIAIHTPIKSGHIYEEGAIFSKDGHCKPFDSDAQGTLFCDGGAVVLLKDLEEAEHDGDTIYAIVKGVGISNDGGEKGSFTAPSSEGQAACIINALDDAKVEPSSISYIEAHGTATPIGDPIEIEGLNIAFGKQDKKQYCAIGSIKSNMGHLIHAAGAAGFIKTCLALHHKQLPPSINFTRPNPDLNLEDSPFYVNDKLSKWESETIRRAGVSSFGVGGTNVHVILEEYIQPEKESSNGRPYELLTWSAKSDDSVSGYAEKLRNHIQQNPDIKLADIAYSLQSTKTDFNHRRFATASSNQDLVEKLNPLFQSADTKTLKEKYNNLVFVFPGQGAQYINMGKELYANEAVFRTAVDECAELLKSDLGEDIRDIIDSDTEDEQQIDTLNNTYYTQPALFVTEYALAKLWISLGIEPNWFIGHSIGEFVAAHLAGVFSLKDALHLIANRGKLMSNLPGGSMLAVRTNHKNIEKLLPADLSIAAINSSHLCVIAGPTNSVQNFTKTLEENDIVSKLLHTSHAFHSSMMDEIVEPFAELVRSLTLRIPQKPIISTVTGTWLKDADATDPMYWAGHLRSTVCFSDAVNTALQEKLNTLFIEIGPRNSSTTLIRQHIQNQQATAIAALEFQNNQNEYVSFLRGIGQAWLHGVEIDWQAYYSEQKRKIVNTPTYAFDKKVCWIDPVPTQPVPRVSAINQSPIHQNQQSQQNIAMRKNELIEKLKSILENASGIETKDMNPAASFFEVGLDSLLLTQIALTLKKEFKLPITFRKLSEELNSLESLAGYLDANLPQETLPTQSTTQTIASSGSLTSPQLATDAVQSSNAINLISQQINLLAQQISLLQNDEQTIGVIAINGSVQATNHNGYQSMQSNNRAEPEITQEEATELKKPFGATAKIDKQKSELTSNQTQYLHEFIVRYNQKTAKSKAYTQAHRKHMADPRVVSGFRPLTKEMTYQLVVEKSKGSYLWDIDGNQYIDMLNGFGSNLLGYQPDFLKEALINQIESGYEIGPQHVLAGEVTKLICEFTNHDRAALCNTGSEAVLGAMRIARTVTGRSLIVAFTGSYHGIIDEVLVRGTKKLKSFPAASGVMPEAVQNMLILDYGTDESLQIIKERADEIAAVLVEPIQSRRPEFQPIDFLKQLREITRQNDQVLIFDEIITGFRMHPGGIQSLFGIQADVATYGKVIGGGASIGVIAGKREYMDALDGGYWEFGNDSIPEVGVTYFAGTFVRHPLALATAKASLLYMKDKGPQLQDDINNKTKALTDNLQRICTKYNLPLYVVRFGSLWKIKYKEEYAYSELLFALMREKGIHILDGFPCFITLSHTTDELDKVSQAFEESIQELLEHKLIPVEKALEERIQENAVHIADEPPVKGARLGKDSTGNPAWFIPDHKSPGKYLQINL